MNGALQQTLEALEGVRRCGDGWEALCPAHDDTNQSLTVGEGDRVPVVLNCHKGCSQDAVLQALRHRMNGHAPASFSGNGASPDHPPKPKKQIPKWNPWKHGKQTAVYSYTDGDGEELFQVVRFELRPDFPRYDDVPPSKRKDFRQRRYAPEHPKAKRNSYAWGRNGIQPVLYRLPSILRTASEGRVVFVVEGEKDVETLREVGLTATCNLQGAGDWKARYADDLAGAHVVILPDNDSDGRDHAGDIAASCHGKAASVRVVELPDLPHKGDVTDWIEDGSTRKALEQLVEATPEYQPPASEEPGRVSEEPESRGCAGEHPVRLKSNGQSKHDVSASYVPFPVDLLPGPAAGYVRACAKALPCAPAMVAVPILAVLSAGVGAAATIRLKRSWKEPSPLWNAVVAPSGSIKSSAAEKAMLPIFQLIEEAKEEARGTDDAPRRYRVDDTTVEAVADVLNENERGVLLYRDELAGWLGSFDRYAQGEADMQSYIAMYEGRPLAVDRKSTKSASISRPAVAVTGTIQPGVLRRRIGEQHMASGFAPRIQLVQPPATPKRFTVHDVTHETKRAYTSLVRELYKVERNTVLDLAREAKEEFAAFVNANGERVFAMPEGPARSVAAKTDGLAARLALVLHLSRRAAGETEHEAVDANTMRRALALARWLRDETLRVYEALELAEAALPTELRFLRKLPDEFKTAEAEALAKEEDIPRRTMFDWLGRLQEWGLLEKRKRGHYRQSYPVASCTHCTNPPDVPETENRPPRARNGESATSAKCNGVSPSTSASNGHKAEATARPWQPGDRARVPDSSGRIVTLDYFEAGKWTCHADGDPTTNFRYAANELERID